MDAAPALRRLPSVDRVVRALDARGWLEGLPRRAATMCARQVLDGARQRLRDGAPEVGLETIVAQTGTLLRQRFQGSLRRAINATGVVLHTNLGRAPLSAEARSAAIEAALGYSTLEIHLEGGGRGSRHAHLEDLLTTVTGAEAGFAVNNNAAAVVLALAALAGGREVVVGRGELVEIGGSFRMPDVMAQSGARLLEIGTTNRTYLRDYEAALGPSTGLLLKVHRSNFTVKGFVHDVVLAELVELGRRRQVPVVFDLGSGCLVDLSAVDLPHEPTVQEAVAAGADLVLFSGDKLLGGPQAGLLVGRRDVVERCRRHPLARAVRLDKLGIAALAATLRSYLDPAAAWREIPILALLKTPPAARRRRAGRLSRALARVLGTSARCTVVATKGEMGGGTLPEVPIPSAGVAVRPEAGDPESLARRLRLGTPPVVSLVRDQALVLDVLALLPGDDRLVVRQVSRAVAGA